jgi:alpha-tubulin suppressor-like RCC1 family protein
MDDDGQSTPKKSHFQKLAAGASHTCGLKTDGKVVCWGGGDAAKDIPDDIFIDISSYGFFGCGIIAESKNVRCWPQSREPPVGPYGAVAAGGLHVCAVRSDTRSIDCWGQGEASQAPAGSFQTEADSKLQKIEVSPRVVKREL